MEHREGKVLHGQAYGYHKSHTIPMTRNTPVLGVVFHLRKNHVENVSGAGDRNGTCHESHERKGHRRKHMGHQTTLRGTESESDNHHRETVIAIIRYKKNLNYLKS